MRQEVGNDPTTSRSLSFPSAGCRLHARFRVHDSCPNLCKLQGFSESLSKNNLHFKIDCLEAWFSEDPVTYFSGMPPGNGMAFGGVLEQNNHYVSPFSLPAGPGIVPGLSNPQQPDFTTGELPSVAGGSLWSADGRLAAVFSTNGSWVTTGTLTVMPKGYQDGHRTDHAGVQISCNKLGPLCTKQILGLHFQASHRSLQTISFYGIGPDSPLAKYVLHEDDTFASISAALPLADWFTFESGAEFRLTDLPHITAPNSVSANFTTAAAPGLSSQPGFGHYHFALRTSPIAILSPRTDDQDDNHTGPLMKPYVQFTFNNSVEYHWYSAPGHSASSFQQFVEDSDENILLGTRVRHYVQVGDAKTGSEHFWDSFLAKTCGDKNIDWSKSANYVLKVRQACGLGDLDLVSHIVASRTGPIRRSRFTSSPPLAAPILTPGSACARGPTTASALPTLSSFRPTTSCPSTTFWSSTTPELSALPSPASPLQAFARTQASA